MFEFHVTNGPFKKIVKSESNVANEVQNAIKKAFSLDFSCSLHMQYWHLKFNDWVDCEDLDELNDDSKLNVWQNDLDLQTLDTSSTSIPSTSNVEEIRSSTPTPFTEDFDSSKQMTTCDFPYLYKLPHFPAWVQNLLENRSPFCKEAKCRRAITDALFDDLLRYGSYPTSRIFQETGRSLVEAYPVLKDKQYANASQHESWVIRLRDKFKKYRSRHAELCNPEELERMKVKYGKKRERSEVNSNPDTSLTLVKRIKVLQALENHEDEFSISIHLKVLKEECLKRKPDADLIRDKMMRTFEHRTKYITNHSVAETLTCFPPLRHTNELLNEGKRLGISEAILREFLEAKKNSLLDISKKTKEKNKRLSQLLSSQAECVCTEDTELAFNFLALSCLMHEKCPLVHAEEEAIPSVLEPVIVYRQSANIMHNTNYELFLDRQLVTTAENLVTAATLWFALFWIFDVGYTKTHIKLLSFLDAFVFKKCSLTSVPRSVKSLFNII